VYSIGGRFQSVTTVTLDASYPTGGYTVTPASLGLPAGFVDVIDANTGPDSGFLVTYNIATNKMQAFVGAAGAADTEVANATNLATVTAQLVTTGR